MPWVVGICEFELLSLLVTFSTIEGLSLWMYDVSLITSWSLSDWKLGVVGKKCFVVGDSSHQELELGGFCHQ